MTSRRNFLGTLGAGAGMPALVPGFPGTRPDRLQPISTEYDMSWVDRIDKPHKVVFDSPSVDDGGALWRIVLLRREYQQVYGAEPDQFGAVLVVRHLGVAMAMNDNFWAKDGVGEKAETKGRDGKWATHNPVGPTKSGASEGRSDFTIPGFIASGGIVLACDMAFGNVVVGKYREDGMSRADARELALKDLIPGVILQPSGFFATVRAQEAGCAAFFN